MDNWDGEHHLLIAKLYNAIWASQHGVDEKGERKGMPYIQGNLYGVTNHPLLIFRYLGTAARAACIWTLEFEVGDIGGPNWRTNPTVKIKRHPTHERYLPITLDGRMSIKPVRGDAEQCMKDLTILKLFEDNWTFG